MASNNRFYFHVTHGTDSRIVHPSEATNGKLSYFKNDDEAFYRMKFSGSMVFDNKHGDFDYFAALEQAGMCDDIFIDVVVYCDDVKVVKWNGKFSTGSGKFNFDRCLFTVTPTTYDDNYCLDKLLKKDFDTLRVFKSGVGLNIYTAESTAGTLHTLVHTADYHFTTLTSENCKIDTVPVTCPSDFLKWCYVSEEVIPISTNRTRIITTYQREEILIPPSGGICVAPDESWTYDSVVGGDCLFYRCGSGVSLEYDRMRMLNEIIDAILNQPDNDCTFEYQSIFFDFQPNVLDPVYLLTSSGLNNYVSVFTSAPNLESKTRWLMWAQKSDIKDPLASNPATKGVIKFSKLLQDLRFMFNVYYSCVDGVFKLEHISYYERYSVVMDLTLYKKEQAGKNEYEHLSDDIPKRETFHWMEGDYPVGAISFDDFVGRPIIYDSECARGDEIDYAVDDITTNLQWIVDAPDEISDDGFVVLATKLVSGVYNINYEIGFLSGNGKLNAHLSWANLHQNYHRHNRFLPSGNMNDNAVDFLSWKPNIKQVPFDIQLCCEETFNPNAQFLSVLGEKYLQRTNGRLYSADFNLSRSTITIVLKYSY